MKTSEAALPRDADEPGEFDVGGRLLRIRRIAGLSQRQLAERAGVPHGLISMIERNHSSPSVASLRKILGGVPMTLAEFFEPEASSGPADQVFFAPDELLDLTSRLSHEHGASTSGRLTLRQVGNARAHNLQILHEVYQVGADTGETMLEHDSHEGGVVLQGEIELTVGEQVRVLRPGDAFLFDSRKPHRFRNTSDAPAILVSACTPPYL